MQRAARLLLTALLCSATSALAQGSYMHYENHNQVDPRPIRLDEVAGIVRGPGGKPIPQVQVGIFGEDHVQVAAIHTNRLGRFAALYEPFCTANIPVFVAPSGVGRAAKTLEIHMVAGGIDTCSFGVAQ